MPNIQNRAGEIMMRGAQSQAQGIMQAGRAQGQMYANLGQTVSDTIGGYFEQKKRKQMQDAAENELIGLGYNEEDAKGIAKSFKDPSDLLKYKQVKMQEEETKKQDQYRADMMAKQEAAAQSKFEADTIAKQEQAKVVQNVGAMLNQMDSSDPETKTMQDLFAANPTGMLTAVQKYMSEDASEREKRKDSLSHGYATQEEALATLGDNSGTVTQDKQSGRFYASVNVPNPKNDVAFDWDKMMTWKVPQKVPGKDGVEQVIPGSFQEVKASAKQAVEAGLAGTELLKEAYAEKYGMPGGGIPELTSQEQYDQLPKGAQFYFQGKLLTKN